MSNETCEHFIEQFESINQYFRDEMVIEGSPYNSKELGYAIVAAYTIVIFFGAFGNFLTILVVILNPAMRTTRNFFILNLALSDFFVCTVTAPITLYTVLYMFWPFGTAMCKIAGSLQGFNIFLSTFSIAAIALDRYVLIIFPTKRDRQQSLSIIFFILIWIVSLSFAVPLLLASDLNMVYEDSKCGIVLEICHEQNEIWETMLISKRTYTLAVLATQYAFPLFSLVFAYSRIAHRMKLRFANNVSFPHSLHSSQRRRSVVERQRRTHLLLMCVVAVFAIAWFPLNVFHLVHTFEFVQNFSVSLFSLCHVIAMCSACLNPLIYAFFNQNFRTEFIALFDKVGLSSLRLMLFGEPPPKKGMPNTRARTVCMSVAEPTTTYRKPEESCVPKCTVEHVAENLVPAAYNNCICASQPSDNVKKSSPYWDYFEESKCEPHYRSLKFRQLKTGAVALHKAAVRSCASTGIRIFVNQSIFDLAERAFLVERGWQRISNLESTYSTWVFGFRKNFMQFYKKPDSHLRFG
ncbi:unnamed protein product [Caenorhabditis auriculariae]|uniref:G-protein coupled receptors family 1 profile domain-containing protein n=1 Tax=Caenorhabditis auriculariae TaxID=2777116 RepID=A0A8S1GTZ3_9PELO|nr:unnamed protein product [Caenorhabditis auriculariae]